MEPVTGTLHMLAQHLVLALEPLKQAAARCELAARPRLTYGDLARPMRRSPEWKLAYG